MTHAQLQALRSVNRVPKRGASLAIQDLEKWLDRIGRGLPQNHSPRRELREVIS